MVDALHRYLDQTLNGGLDMSNAHRDVPPVEDMLHLAVATDGIPYEVRESKLAVRDYRQQTALNRPGFTGGQNSRRIARYGTESKEDLEAVFT